jgi:hypothetical protein
MRETKSKLKLDDYNGVLLCVNDDFRELPPQVIMGIISRILLGSYSSIDAFIYLTNHYVQIPGMDTPCILWAPAYADTAPDTLVRFVNYLGKKWFDLCEQMHGPFEFRQETPNVSVIFGARALGTNFPYA